MYRIMIADTDLAYCEIIQGWILEKYGEHVQLEIITDKSYYREAFKKRCELELLIVSRELYKLCASYDYVSSVMILEDAVEDFTNSRAAGLYHVDKYSNTQAILYTLENLIDGEFRKRGESKQKTQLLLITSASGGVGKTSLSLGVSAAMQRLGKNVLYMDAEYLQTFAMYMQEKGPIRDEAFYEVLERGQPITGEALQKIYRKEMFYYLPPFKKALVAMDKDISLFTQIMQAAMESGEFDYVVVDTGKEFSLEKAKWLGMADKVMIVKTAEPRSEYEYEVLRREISDIDGDKYIIVNNMSADQASDGEGRKKSEYRVRTWKGEDAASIQSIGHQEDIVKICYLL